MSLEVCLAGLRSQVLTEYHASKIFKDIFNDHLECLTRLREFEIRVRQLEKESAEIRAENEALHGSLESIQRDSVENKEYQEVKEKASELQEELLGLYKEKDILSEQLGIVRETCGKQIAEIEQMARKGDAMNERVRKLEKEISDMKHAQEITSKELKDRIAREEEAATRAEALEEENRDLVSRIIHLKDLEADRMNEMNRLREEIIRDAKAQANEIIALSMKKAKALSNETNVEDLVDKMTMGDILESEKPKKMKSVSPKIHAGGCTAVTFEQAGMLMATCGLDKTVRIWDTSSLKVQSTLRGAHETVNDVAVTCDARFVLGAEDHQAVRIWDLKSSRLVNIALTGHLGKVTAVSTFPTDSQQAATCATDRSIKLWKLDKGVSSRTIPFTSTAKRVRVVSDSGTLVSGHFDGRIRFWDARSKANKPSNDVDAHSGREICGIHCNISINTIAAVGRDNSVSVIDTRKFSVLHKLGGNSFEADALCQPAISPCGGLVAAGSKDGSIFVFDITTGKEAGTLPTIQQLRHPSKEHQDVSIVACAWNPVGLPLAAADRVGTVSFWT